MQLFDRNINYLLKEKRIDESKLKKIEFGKIKLKNALKIADQSGYSLEELISKDIEKKESKLKNLDIKLLVTDVDGVLTDGGLFFTKEGDEIKKFNAKDGMGLKQLMNTGCSVGFLSSGLNGRIVEERGKMLGVQYIYVGSEKKLDVLKSWCAEMHISLQNVAYVGDDSNDIEVLKNVGLSVCPADAIDILRKNADIVLNTKGGFGCIRELIDMYLIKR
jgi:YrbI family 3-deoxy-D-manno-octulosonate 8-phosphate phosphatase